MPATSKQYGLFLKSLATKKIDLSADSLKVMLCTSAYTPNQDTHQYKSDVTNEVAGTGYAAGGVALANVTLTYDGPSNTLTLDADDAAWAGATLTARYAVVYDASPASDATRPLIAYIDFGADVTATSGSFQVVFAAAGIATITAA